MTVRRIRIGDRHIGPRQPTYVIAEIGINHNGSIDHAKALIDAAAAAGCCAVKFQKRTPERCVPDSEKDKPRDTPWGTMSYLDYRRRMEFSEHDYAAIAAHCDAAGVDWFASVWDVQSVDFVEQFSPLCHKVPSAALTDHELLNAVRHTGRPAILSTGMSTLDEISTAVTQLSTDRLVLMHCTSSYPCATDELNLRMITTLCNRFEVPVGYSGHESGIVPTVAAVAVGACVVERHITLDKTMWGSDHAASLEPRELTRLVNDIRTVETALGTGEKQVYASEIPAMKKLRRH